MLLTGILAATFSFQKVAHNLDATPSKIHSQKNRDRFMTEMNGGDDGSAKRTGQKLPDGFSKDKIISDLTGGQMPKNIDATTVKVGAVDYPLDPEFHVVWASGVTGGDDVNTMLWLGLQQGDPKTAKWPVEAAREIKIKGSATVDDIDLSSYKLGGFGRAIGVEVVKGEGYSGGFSDQEDLILVVPYQGKLTEVLETPLEFFGMFAGDWHKDGTRSHQIVEESSKLTVSSQGEVPNLVKTLSGRKKRKQHFVFDRATAMYQTKDKEVLDHAE